MTPRPTKSTDILKADAAIGAREEPDEGGLTRANPVEGDRQEHDQEKSRDDGWM